MTEHEASTVAEQAPATTGTEAEPTQIDAAVAESPSAESAVVETQATETPSTATGRRRGKKQAEAVCRGEVQSMWGRRRLFFGKLQGHELQALQQQWRDPTTISATVLQR